MKPDKIEITLLPSGKSVRVVPGTTLFKASQEIGLPIESACGGRGTCGKCKVQVEEGWVRATQDDERFFTPDELDAGWRLSCQAKAKSDTAFLVPALMHRPRAAPLGASDPTILAPGVRKILIELPKPSLSDQRSDKERTEAALRAEGQTAKAEVAVLKELSGLLRGADFRVTAAVGEEDIIALEPGDTRDECYGVAFDVGTTTVVVTLMNLRTGLPESVASTLNAQAPFGADVISRISHAMDGVAEREELRRAVVDTLNQLLEEVLRKGGVSRDRVYEALAVGNATMLHLLLGVDPSAIAVTPFVPVFCEPLRVRADELGLMIHPRGHVRTLPILGAYVGADAVAAILSTGLGSGGTTQLMVDVGTNAEIVLSCEGRILATAAPAGPAFEGGQIRCGMRASDGAVETVRLGSAVEVGVIGGDRPPLGICGSGLVDLVAQLRLVGLLDASGRLRGPADFPAHSLRGHLVEVEGMTAFQLAEGVFITQKDIRELQLAKASIAAGIHLLLELLGLEAKDLDEIQLAGAFGSYINPESAVQIGMVPSIPVEKIVAIGNAASQGAKMSLVSSEVRKRARELANIVEYIEFSGRAEFNDVFVSFLEFPELEDLS